MNMIATRIRQIALLLFATLLSGMAFLQMFFRVDGYISANYAAMLILVMVLFFVFWGVLLVKQPYASQAILPCIMLLTAIGTVLIARIDRQNNTNVAIKQMVWICAALVLSIIFVILLKDYRILRRFSYVNMVIGLILLLSPMVPGLGKEIGGARIWIGFGDHTVQPGEFAKLFLSFFFAAYLFNHRDRLAVGGNKVLGIHLPRLQDMGPIALVWAASMGVLVIQHDLGTSLMFFAMFVSMLYVATGRRGWIAVGGIAFVAGCLMAVKLFAHVQYRVDSWLHPFDNAVYNRFPGGSAQIVSGLFGLAAGGTTGTGLGQGHPSITPLANSDFIYASVGEELGLTGLLAVLVLYLIIIASGMITAMKIKDGFGKLLASGLVFTMAFQVFTVVGGITLVIPLTGLTLPYMAAGGSSLVANYLLASLLIVISHAANKPESAPVSDTFQYAALAALRERELQERANTNTNNSEYNNTNYENNIDSSAVISSSERGDNNE
ncbi:FtsW/RodA/SpoVE family cell cycle protein [Gardnerella vaginalis]|uniref:FtsW/RodA/SpoVE family cell cycle protein n=1 Tax=Gardnerella vaginalis TaxID=2702 RepID=UPI0039EE1FFC